MARRRQNGENMDEYGLDREYRRTRDESRVTQTAEKKKTDGTVRVTAVQCCVCALLVLTAFGIKKAGGSAYESLKGDYQQIVGQDIGVRGIFSDTKNIFSFLLVPEKEESVAAAASVSEALSHEGAESDETYTSGAQSDELEVVENDAQIVTVTSSGGEDIRIMEGLSSSSFAPVKLSVKAVTPVSGKVTSSFGYRIHPITGNESFHTGIDIAAKTGTDIAAAFAGTVEEVGETNARGKYILISHGDGVKTLYCHCDEILAQEGAVIRAGETVALVGSTGWSTGPHLHFELRIDGVRCNPEWILPDLS